MKKIIVLILIDIMLFSPFKIEAARGCCSHHGGVGGCSSSGRQICNDGTLSPTCTCTPMITYIYGCTDRNASNYNSNANKDDGSCIYYVYGCTDKTAKNYDKNANKDNGTCEYYVYGCTNSLAENYNPYAEKDDGSCILSVSNDVAKIDINNNDEKKDNNGFLGAIIELGTISGGVYLYNKRKQK